jgi:membrane protease YdiL (CAAX protease family)
LGRQGTAGELSVARAPLRWAFMYVAWLLAAWTLAWTAFTWSEARYAWLAADAGSFTYWTALKVLVWLIPALWLIKASGRSLADAFGFNRIGAMLAWGLAAGLLLAVLNIAVRDMVPPSPELSWALLNAALVAPIVEEVAFRGAVLGAVNTRLSFPMANTITAALFVLAHAPGWWFQGRLIEMLTAPIGGALSIFVLGWLFGWIAHRSRTVGAPIIAHALNNFTSFG